MGSNGLTWQETERGFFSCSGQYGVASVMFQDTGPVPHWSWGVSCALAAGYCDTPALAINQAEAAWRAWLAKASLVDERSSPLRVVLAGDDGLECAHPDDDYVIYSGALIIGMMT